MYIEKISHDRSPYESVPEQASWWPLVTRIALAVMLLTGLTVALVMAPRPPDNDMDVAAANSSLAGSSLPDSPLEVGP